MGYITGFGVWIAFAIVAAFLIWTLFRGPGTKAVVTFVFAVLGTFIGGMLGVSGYVFHDPSPLRFGGLAGALIGAFFFPFVYHFVGKKAL